MTRLFLILLASIFASDLALALPSYASLAGLANTELDDVIATLMRRTPQAPPGPLKNTSAILVNDCLHPWMPAGKDDIRGPCPGLNTLASHGWLPRNGIASPSQIITAVQEGFNMGNNLAVFLAYAAHLVDGNLLTDLLSIGGKTSKTGPNPPLPAIVGDLGNDAVFEGDASTTHADAFFGDNHSFNETLFDKFVVFSNKFGDGFYSITVAAKLRVQRIQDSTATNPQFSLRNTRYYTAYGKPVFPFTFFIDGAHELPLRPNTSVARGLFQASRMPDDFHRLNISWTTDKIGPGIRVIFKKHPVAPSAKNGMVNSYILDSNSADFSDFCMFYTDFVNVTVRGLYPDAKGALLDALNTNLDFLYSSIQGQCTQVPPFVAFCVDLAC